MSPLRPIAPVHRLFVKHENSVTFLCTIFKQGRSFVPAYLFLCFKNGATVGGKPAPLQTDTILSDATLIAARQLCFFTSKNFFSHVFYVIIKFIPDG